MCCFLVVVVVVLCFVFCVLFLSVSVALFAFVVSFLSCFICFSFDFFSVPHGCGDDFFRIEFLTFFTCCDITCLGAFVGDLFLTTS